MVLKTLLVKIGADVSDFNKKMASVSSELDKRKGAIQGSLNKISFAVGGMGIAAMKMSIDFNKSMANVATLIPGNVTRVNELKYAVQEMAMATGKGTQDISDGLYQVISAFGDTSDTVKVLEINVKAAAAGLATTTDAINLTSAVTKGYGDTTAAAVEKAADLAFLTVKLGQTTFPELAASIGTVVPAANKMNVSQEELFATMATLTGVTGDASRVSTQLSGILGAMIKPTEAMSMAIAKLGYDSAEAMIQELGLVGSLDALIGTTDGTAAAVGQLISRKEALTGAFALTGAAADDFHKKLGIIREEVKKGGAMETAFGEISEGINKTGFNFDQLKQHVIVLAQRIGDELAPVLGKLIVDLKPIIEKMIGLVKAFADAPAPIKAAVLALGGLLALSGPLFKALMLVKSAIPMLVSGFSLLKTGVSALMGPVGLVTAAFAGGLAIGTLLNKIKPLREAITGLCGKFIDLVGAYKPVAAEWQKGHTDAEAKRQKMLAKATEIAGKEITKYGEAFDILKEQYKKTGDLGDETLNSWAEKATTAEEGIQKFKEGVKETKEAAEKARPPIVDLSEEAAKFGITLKKDLKVELDATREALRRFKEMHELTPDAVTKLEEKIRDLEVQLGLTTKAIEAQCPEMRELYDIATIVPGAMYDITESEKASEQALYNFSSQVGKSAIDVKKACYNMAADFMSLAGVSMPRLGKASEQATTEMKSHWTDVSQRIKDSWTKSLSEMLQGTTSVKDGLNSIWDIVKTQFFDMVAQMIVSWSMGFVKKILSGGAGVVGGILDPFKQVAEGLTGSSSGEGEGGIFGGMGGSFIGNMVKMAGPLGIGLLIGKMIGFENIANTFKELWSGISDVAVGAVKLIGQALDVVAEVGLKAFKAIGEFAIAQFQAVTKVIQGIGDLIGGMLSGLGAIFKGIGGLFSKGKKFGEITHWLKPITENTQKIYNQLSGPIQGAIDGVFKPKMWEMSGNLIRLVSHAGWEANRQQQMLVRLKQGVLIDKERNKLLKNISKMLNKIKGGSGGVHGLYREAIRRAKQLKVLEKGTLKEKRRRDGLKREEKEIEEETQDIEELKKIKEGQKEESLKQQSVMKVIGDKQRARDNIRKEISKIHIERTKRGNKILLTIKDNTRETAKLLRKLKGGQKGLSIPKPALIKAGEVPETLVPNKDLASLLQDGGKVNLTLAPQYNISAMDARGVRDFIRNQGGPELIEYIKVNLGKREIKEALGL